MSPSKIQYVDYKPYGTLREIFTLHDKELVVAGPAGTGKSRACLEKVNMLCEKYSNVRACMVRKTRKSLTQSGMVTLSERVFPARDWARFHTSDQEYRYPNNSIIAVGGIDDPAKILSSEWDIVYVQQAEELDLGDWEAIVSRLRNNRMPYQQIIGDCNPSVPHHWIKQRALIGPLKLVESRHEDNPILFNQDTKEWTSFGKEYLTSLDAMTGARYQRLRLGNWASAEGAVYENSWDRAVHVIDRFVLNELTDDQVPIDWPRYWVVDFGYTNPFVWQAWAEDHDGRLFRYKEIYHHGRTVEEHCKTILSVTRKEPKPRAIICDHDAEDRATLERHLGVRTKAARKFVSPGIQAVETRLKKAKDGMPRIFLLRDSLVEVDRELMKDHKPCCTEDEIEGYIWDTSNNRKLGEEPVKKNDHGCDAMRYLVAEVDDVGIKVNKMFVPISVYRDGVKPSNETSLERPSYWRMNSGLSREDF